MDKKEIVWRKCTFCEENHNEDRLNKIIIKEPYQKESRLYYLCPDCAYLYNELLLLGKIYKGIKTGVIVFDSKEENKEV